MQGVLAVSGALLLVSDGTSDTQQSLLLLVVPLQIRDLPQKCNCLDPIHST